MGWQVYRGEGSCRILTLGADPLRDGVEAIGSRMAGLLDGQVDLAMKWKNRRRPRKPKE